MKRCNFMGKIDGDQCLNKATWEFHPTHSVYDHCETCDEHLVELLDYEPCVIWSLGREALETKGSNIK